MAKEKIFYINEYFELWLLELDILEDEIIIKNWKKYNIEMNKGKFINDKSIKYETATKS